MLSDSDVEDEAEDVANAPAPSSTSLHLTTTTSRASDMPPRRLSTSADVPPSVPEQKMRAEGEGEAIMEDTAAGVEGRTDQAMEEESPEEEMQVKRTDVTPGRQVSGMVIGPKKTKVMLRDAAWCTWWAVLYWVNHLFLPVHIRTDELSCTRI